MKENVIEPAKKKIGITVNYTSEKVSNFYYNIFYSLENGYGYNSTISNSKPINLLLSISSKNGKYSISAGFDININGYGVGMQIGSESSISFHANNNSVEIGNSSSFLRLYIKNSYISDTGLETYNKIYINNAEIAVAVMVIDYLICPATAAVAIGLPLLA